MILVNYFILELPLVCITTYVSHVGSNILVSFSHLKKLFFKFQSLNIWDWKRRERFAGYPAKQKILVSVHSGKK